MVKMVRIARLSLAALMLLPGLMPALLRAQAPLSAPKGQPLLTLEGKGSQVYRCHADAWVLDHPDADLLDKAGKVVGHHDAGPAWHSQDGSSVHGEAVEKVPAPEPNSVPWLVVRATTHDGTGVLAEVETIRRTNTHGGVAPGSGCAAGHEGEMLRVPYTATYTFYGKP